MRLTLTSIAFLTALLLPYHASHASANFDQTDLAREFAQLMQKKHGISAAITLGYLKKANHRQSILNAITRQPEGTATWLDYKRRFVNSQHIRDGKKFMRRHSVVLQRAHDKYGVPPHIITAIIGVESNYGRLKGSYRTMDALATIAFSSFRRADFFLRELEEFILLSHSQQRDPFSYVSSYAGAMGLGQFLPSSYRSYAVDFDGDGVVSLHNSTEDTIGSIANYLYEFGWQPNGLVALAAKRVSQESSMPKYNTSFTPNITIKRAKTKYGIAPLQDQITNKDKITLLRFEAEQPPLWFGMHNYYVLTRYNNSHKYAMSLYLLSRAITP